MVKNYFEHDIQVKYVEKLLDNSNDWQWLVDYIECNFEIKTDANSFLNFMDCFSTISEIYLHFIKIRELPENVTLSFSNKHIENLYVISGVLCGKTSFIENMFDSDFFNMLSVVANITRLINVKNGTSYVNDFRIFTTTNLYELYDLSGIQNEAEEMVRIITSIHFEDIESIANVVCKNLNKERQNYNPDFFAIYSNNLVAADSFSMQRINPPDIPTWEERYLLDMLMVSIIDKKLVPLAQFGANTTPDISCWTVDRLNKMSAFFSNDAAQFVIETIKYIRFGICMSNQILQKHFDLLSDILVKNIEEIGNYQQIKCSSMEICSYVISDGIVPTLLRQSCIGKISQIVTPIIDINMILLIESYDLPISIEQRKKVNEYHQTRYQLIYNIDNYDEMIRYLCDEDVQKHINPICFIETHSRFISIIEQRNDSLLANLFYEYLLFLLAVQKNDKIQSQDLRAIIIEVKHLWQDHYYDISRDSMHVFSKSFSMTSDQVMNTKKFIIEEPLAAAHAAMLQGMNDILQNLKLYSSNPLTLLITSLQINEYFPHKLEVKHDGDHEVDNQIFQTVDKINNDNKYRFLNQFETREYMSSYYESISQKITLFVQVFSGTEELYEIVQKKLPNYAFLPYPQESAKLGDVTQLFPMMECKIREVGELCNIVPFRMKIGDYMRVKEPSSILSEILSEVYKLAKTHEGASDLLFIYYSMYNSNGMNIRNECIHGKSYQKAGEIDFAFRLTLICLHMIIWRLEKLRGAEKLI